MSQTFAVRNAVNIVFYKLIVRLWIFRAGVKVDNRTDAIVHVKKVKSIGIISRIKDTGIKINLRI
jgi:hypothetical protein